MTITPNGVKPNAGEIRQIILFLKELLPNSLVKAISLLLHPCCDLGLSAEVTCGSGADLYDIAITVGNPPVLFGATGGATLVADGVVYAGTISDDGKLVSFTDVDVSTSPATVIFSRFLPTSANGLIGVTVTNTLDITLPVCP